MRARAARLVEPGAPLRVEEIDLPQPGADEELVILGYAGVNPVDRYNSLGRVAADGPLPRTLGSEASGWTADGGLVLVAGSGLGMSRDGVYATHVVAPRDAIVPVPSGVQPEVAAAAGVAGLTAYSVANLVEPADGETVLVLGAGGGVGLPLVSYLTHLGARVFGQVGTAAKVEAVRAAGAVEVVVADGDSLADALRSATGKPFVPDAVTDPLGGKFVRSVVEMLPTGGRYVVYGTSADAEVTLNWQTMYRKGLRISGYGGLTLTSERRRAALEAVLPLIARGEMRIPIQRTYPLGEVSEAFSAIAGRTITGKVLLDLRA